MKIILTKGLPASGKSTWAKEHVAASGGSFKRINKDDLRAMLDDGKWSHGNEKFVLSMRDAMIRKSLESGKSVIVDDANLTPKHEARVRQIAREFETEAGRQVTVEVKFFDVPLETCIERDLKRPASVGESVIRKMYRDYLRPAPPAYRPAEHLPHAIICDLDGTLALLNGRNPYDASTCYEDECNAPVLSILKAMQLPVLFVSARPDNYKPETFRWLCKHVPANLIGSLHMRKEGDARKDAIVKREIFDGFIANHFNIRFVLDDRNQVVEMWRSLGLTCLQVAEGDF